MTAPPLILRVEQLAPLRRIDRPASRARIVAHLELHHADLLVPHDAAEVAEIVDAAMDRAAALGFVDEVHLAWFAVGALAVSPRFSEHPRIHALLTDEACPLSLRVKWTLANIGDVDWEEAAAL